MMATERRLRLPNQLGQQWNGRLVLAFVEQTGRGVTMPAVLVLKGRDQVRGARAAERDGSATFPRGIRRCDAVDAAAIIPTVQVEVLLDLLGNAPRVLDHLAIHVADVECAI